MSNNNIWQHFEAYQQQHQKVNNVYVNQNDPNLVAAYVNANPDWNWRPGYNDNWEVQYVKEQDIKVGEFVVAIYREFYPLKCDTWPSRWIGFIVAAYRSVRSARSKKHKMHVKNAMKGLRLHLIVGSLLHCMLISDGNPIPPQLLLTYINKAIRRGKKLTLKEFENYRTDRKKGIRVEMSRLQPACYEDVSADKFIQFGARNLLGFTTKDIAKAKKLAIHVQDKFNFMVSAPSIAIACMLVVGIGRRYPISASDFTDMTLERLRKLYGDVIKFNTDVNVTDLKLLPPKDLFKKSKKSASIKF
jgi:hypothetical protein